MSKEKVIKLFKLSRKYIGFLIILLTISAFVWYIRVNPGALDPLKSAPLYLIPLLISMYVVFLTTNFFITVVTIARSGKRYPLKASFLLTIYSTLVNFFGPLQSGPGFRAVYLKKKIGLKIKDYSLITMLYYGAFLVISLFMMFGLYYPMLSGVLILAIVTGGLWLFRNQKISTLIKNSLIIGLVTLAQVLIIACIYYLELRVTGPTPSISSTLAYTGSANLALFVAFTPGAIGIRESFIIFSQSLHGIPTEQIVNASLLDRSVYIVFLGFLFILSSVLHIHAKFESSR